MICSIYPTKLTDQASTQKPAESICARHPSRSIEHQGGPGVVLAFDDVGLLRLAQQANCVIELVPQVGDFVAPDDPLFRLYDGGQSIDDRVLHRSSPSDGNARSSRIRRSPFGSSSILLRRRCRRPSTIRRPRSLPSINSIISYGSLAAANSIPARNRDGAGTLRLVYRTPNWEDFVHLAVTEIRQFGGESIQVARRLHAMLEDLIQILPPQRGELIRKELSLLYRSTQRYFTEPEDHALAEISDAQGVGGSQNAKGQSRV